MKKIILSIIAVVCCMTASAEPTQPSTGDGTKENPYQIGSLDNLLRFADYVNSDSQHASACAILMTDITMNDGVLDSNGDLNSGSFDAWTPIGGHGVDYSGEFDGNGHTISGLYFKNTETNNVGLFGKTASEAYIHDLGVKDSYFYGNSWVGGICGDFASGRIENCWNGATVIANGNDAGGICGSCWQYATIANCYNIGDVSLIQGIDAEPKVKFGGICGTVSYNASASYSIDNCYTLMHRSMPKDDATDPYEGLPYLDLNSDKIYGVLDGDAKVHDSYVKKAEAFAGGEVCYRLNRGVTDGSQKWYQTLRSDLSPVMDNGNNTVYYGYDGDVLKYSNTTLTIPTTKHEQCDATCNARGYSQDCWEDTKSGKIYAEAACLHELNQAAVISYIPSAADPTYQINATESLTGWTQEVNKKYDGVNFGYAAVKKFEDYDGTNDNYGTDEWVSFKVADANAKNVRLKWAWTGDKTKQSNGSYGDCDLYYKVNNGGETKITTSTLFEVAPEVYVLNLGSLNKDDVVEFHIKGYANKCTTPNQVIWAVTLEYVSGHNPQYTSAKAATCTEKGNKEYWYCSKCKTYFTSAECTTVMNDWEIPALGHTATHNLEKAATCTEDGNIEHWHCSRCGNNYSDQDCANLITDDVVLPMIGHKNKEHHGRIEATCLADGSIEYWYCPDCETYYKDATCTQPTTEYVIDAPGHDFIYTPYKTSTCTSKGDVEHWHCNRCEKDFNTGEQTASEDHVISGSLTIPCKESDVILVGMDKGKIYDDCHTFTPPTEEGETTIATVTLGEGVISIKIKNGEETAYSLNETKPLETFFAHTFTLKANKDPEHTENYYSTFFTNEYAYKVPTMAKAYEGDVESGDDADVLKLSSVGGVIPQGEAVILKATDSSIELLPSARRLEASSENDLEGTDKEKTLGANQYALSLGQEGVGFYLWEGKSIGANKAYLTLNASAGAKAFIFQFDDDPTGIEEASPISSPEGKDLMYDLNGVRVNESYKGIVIKNGKKIYQK